MSADTIEVPALARGRTAVITGAASGIGLAVRQDASQSAGMKIVLADRAGRGARHLRATAVPRCRRRR